MTAHDSRREATWELNNHPSSVVPDIAGEEVIGLQLGHTPMTTATSVTCGYIGRAESTYLEERLRNEGEIYLSLFGFLLFVLA